MKFSSLAVTSLAVALAAVLTASTAAANDECSAFPRPQMRVRLTMSPERTMLDREAIERVVERIWQAEGIEISWVGPEDAWTWSDIDAWIHLDRTSGDDRGEPPAGHGHGKFIQISVDTTIARMEEALARRLQLPAASASHLVFAGGQLERSLGYAVAHELGHRVLGLTSHAATGLMRPASELFSGAAMDFDAVRLDAKSRALLRDRLMRGEHCVAAR